ncbi:MAG: YfhL family 4Fe-4S dicluster ferredoxin [Myxococcales bacterium]|nr:YfhL family 4Fe-4S dicluster ferredoxin [Myxococcales bacterium]
MSTRITEECINCGACEPECPNEAISEGDEIYVIDPSLCTECVGFHGDEACQSVCPVECCVPDADNRETEPGLLAKAQKLHPDDNALQALVVDKLDEERSRFRNPNWINAGRA